MVIRYVTGDATRPEGEGPKVIVHVCNDAGGWGRGFVLAVSRRWKGPELAYRKAASLGQLRLGDVQHVAVGDGLWIANMIAQVGYARRVVPVDDYAIPLRYDALKQCLAKVANFCKFNGASAHMPRIGCGLAGGKWELVEPIINETLTWNFVPVVVYDPP